MKWKNFELRFDAPLIMGVVNVTPDSFSDGGKFYEVNIALSHAHQLIQDGADIIDIGGESSRPDAAPISAEEELQRVLPVLTRLAKETAVPISIDTYKPEVALECVEAGAAIVNDITGLRAPNMITTVASLDVPVIIMHMQGTPQTMQQKPQYSDVILDIKEFFKKRIAEATNAGINHIILDPGIGFGKSLEQNLEIFRRLSEFTDLGYPILIGPSRKSFIEKITGAEVEDRLPGTIAASIVSILNGANIVRVHDVKECKQAAEVLSAIQHN